MEAEPQKAVVVMGWRAYNGVTAFVGLPGSGKTYCLVDVAVRRLKQGRAVWSNFNIVADEAWPGTFHQFTDIEELILVPPGTVVLLDEAQNMFNARLWQEFPPGFLYRLSQVRKDGLEFYWSSVAEEFVDANLRRLTANVWYCRSITARWFRRLLFGPMELRRHDDKPRAREWRHVKLDVAKHYDTLEKVAVRRSWLVKVLKLSEDPFIPVPQGATMEQILEIAANQLAIAKAGRSPARVRAKDSARRTGDVGFPDERPARADEERGVPGHGDDPSADRAGGVGDGGDTSML